MSAVPHPFAPPVPDLQTRVDRLEAEIASLRGQAAASAAENRLSLCVVSGDFERVTTALMLANTAAAMEMPASIFFAFWGVQAVRRERRSEGKGLVARVLGRLLARDVGQLASQRFNAFGLGPALFTRLMRDKSIATPPELLATAQSLGVVMQACTTSMAVFGVTADELLPGVTCCGAAQFIEEASRSRVSLIV